MFNRAQCLLLFRPNLAHRGYYLAQRNLGLRRTIASDSKVTNNRNSHAEHQTGQDSYGLITTTSPHSTTIEQLLAELNHANRFSQGRDGGNGPSLLALFLTPSYAQHALDPDLPLKAFKELKGSNKHGKDVRTVTAVVDRVPTADREGDGPSNGAEGLAYLYLDNLSPAQETLLSVRALQESSFASSKQLSHSRPGHLWFRMDASPEQPVRTDIQLPLAQTVFSTGRTSTMMASNLGPRSAQDQTLLLSEDPVALESQHLPLIFGNGAEYASMTLAPLTTLTLTRRVEHCMGNIVRTLSSEPTVCGEDGRYHTNIVPNKTQPASSELESAIKDFFSRHDLTPRPVQVWALVLPSSIFGARLPKDLRCGKLGNVLKASKEDLNTPIDPAVMRRLLFHLIWSMGARLCRVLSGGGGWGKKAGLLSLDPDINYSVASSGETTQPADLNLVESTDELEEERKSALGEIVKKGDHIVFLLGPPAFAAGEDTADRQRYYDLLPSTDIGPMLAKSAQSLAFGSLPSSIDDVEFLEKPAISARSSPSSVLHQKDTFGVLSEGGMALTSTPADPRSSKISGESKIDAPFAKIAFFSRGHRRDNK